MVAIILPDGRLNTAYKLTLRMLQPGLASGFWILKHSFKLVAYGYVHLVSVLVETLQMQKMILQQYTPKCRRKLPQCTADSRSQTP